MELTDQAVRKRLYDEQKNQTEQDMSPFGFIMDGTEELNRTRHGSFRIYG